MRRTTEPTIGGVPGDAPAEASGDDSASVYRAYNAAENARDHASMTRLLAPDVVVELNGRPALASAEEDARAMAALFDTYPDYRREILGMLTEGPMVSVRWRMVGRAAARFGDRLPDLDLHGCSVVEVADGRIKRAWLYVQEDPIDGILALAGSSRGR